MSDARKSWFDRFLGRVEWAGNKLPHPVTLFFLLTVGVILLSGVAGAMGWSAADPRPEGAAGRAPDGVIRAVSMCSGDGIRWLITSVVTNFTGFAPLGTVLVALLGVGVAEKSGLLGAAIRACVLASPRRLVTVVIVFAGVMSNAASEMGYVVLIPLAAAIFHSLGRHPLAGLCAAYAGVSGGYSANLILGTVDPLLAGITQESARLLDPEYEVHAAVNWYFMAASTFVVTFLGWWVTEKIVEPRLGRWDSSRAEASLQGPVTLEALKPAERKGLVWAGVSVLVLLLAVVWTALPIVKPGVPEPAWAGLARLPLWGVLRNPTSGELLNSPLLHGVVPLILVFFLIPGFIYGRIAGTMKNDRHVIEAMAAQMNTMGLYIVLVFFAAQFVAAFGYTRLGTILAVVGADSLKAAGLNGPAIFVPFILLCAGINILIASASAKWAVMAPIFVPMMMSLGYSPEVVQCAYRVGDSCTNIITPMMSYFGLILAFTAKYDRDAGIGTLVSTMLPYSLVFLIAWIIFFYIWVFALGLPLGPGAGTSYQLTP